MLFSKRQARQNKTVNNMQMPRHKIAFIWQFMKAKWPLFILLFSLQFIYVMFEVQLFNQSAKLMDMLRQGHEIEFFVSWNELTPVHFIMISALAIPLLGSLFVACLFFMYEKPFPAIFRLHVHEYLLNQDIQFYQKDFAGRLANKVENARSSTYYIIARLIDQFPYAIFMIVTGTLVIWQYNISLSLLFFSWFVVMAVYMICMVPNYQQRSCDNADASSKVTGKLVDAYSNIQSIKLFSTSEQELSDIKKEIDTNTKVLGWFLKSDFVLNVGISVINYGYVILVFSFGFYLYQHEQISIGQLAAVYAFQLRLLGFMGWMTYEIAGVYENIGILDDALQTLSRPIGLQDDKGAEALRVDNGQIDFNQVFFSYSPGSKQVIDQMNLSIQSGEKVALLGHSGAGKSTLIQLLLRFYDVSQGSICIDGQDIAKLSQASLRQHISVVSQDTALLHRSIRDNVRLGANDATDEQIIEALKKAQAWDFVKELSDDEGNQGLDSIVGERGVKLSGGQRQRIAIARIILKDAPILILDEATSALDSEVEQVIMENLEQMMQGKTVIAIAHRLSTIQNMDRLVVMKDGKIIEEGSHDTLLHLQGIYANLWHKQVNGFTPREPVQRVI